MHSFMDLFQWDRFITPTIIQIFYKLVITLIVLFGLSGIWFGLSIMPLNVSAGFMTVLASLVSVLVGIVSARIGTEFILIVFRINDHLGAIRDRTEMR